MSQTGLALVRVARAAQAYLSLDFSSQFVVQSTKIRSNTNSMRRTKILMKKTLSTFRKGLISKKTLRRLVLSLRLV